MKSKLLIAAVIAGSFALAGCGGGDDTAEMMPTDPVPPTAEEERIAELEDELEEAERLAEQERLAKEAAEAERQRLEMEAEEARQAANAAAARRALAGSRATGSAAGITVDPRYNMAAIVTAPAGTSPQATSQTGRWRKTSLTGRTATTVDTVEVYADVEAPDPVNFKDSEHNTGVVNEEGDVDGELTITNTAHSHLVASGSFPRTSAVAQQFDLVDRGPTQAEIDADPNDDITGTGRDTDRHPDQYSVEVSGTLQGASGRFRCGGNADATCTVQNRGDTFNFGGTWVFIPSSGTTKVLVPDAQYMWFGWWARHTPGGDPTWAFQAKHGGEVTSDNIEVITGTATYRGTAAGRYAVYQPVGGPSSTGSFTASASLTANFDTDSLSGSITGFSNDPDWTVALKPGDINNSNGSAGNDGTDTNDPGGVTWTINGAPLDSGSWEAQFYSNLPADEDTGVMPYGIAGTFQADYGTVARMIGAFGAHR